MQALGTLNDKLEELLKKHTALQVENKRLKATIAQQSGSIDVLNKKIASLEKGLGEVYVNKAVLTAEDKNNMRKQLDTVIGEIDKILTTLND